jgi:hypothetical protein
LEVAEDEMASGMPTRSKKHPCESEVRGNAMDRMDAALKAALKMPPRKHKDEKKRNRKQVPSK